MNITSIHDRAMLAYLRIGSWSARKLDTRATKKVTTDSSATTDAARVNKHLLASCDDKLRVIQRIGGEARRYLDNNTLPWDDAGNRLMSNEKAIEVVGELTRYEQQYKDAVADFVVDYPQLREQAQINLGDLANNDDYPPAEHVSAKFSFRLSFSPVPTGFSDARTGLQPAQVEALSKHYEANARRQVSEALKSGWLRLQESLGHYSDRLKEKDDGSGKMQIFRDSMVENLRETCALLGAMNVFDDEELDRVRRRVESDIASFDAQELRDSPLLAKSVRSDVDSILATMRGILGEDA